MAGSSNGGKCVEASGNKNTCNRAIDGLSASGTTANEWFHDGAGKGSWIKIQFPRQYLINTIRVMQRPSAVEQSRGLKLTFMNGSEAFVSNFYEYHGYVLY